MDELAKSISTWFKEKTSNPVYFTFLLYVVICNWRVFYVLFFEDATLLTMPRIEYAERFNVQNRLIGLLWHFVLPTLLTFITIRYLPYVYTWAHRYYTKHHFDRLRIADEARRDFERDRARFLAETAGYKEQQATNTRRIEQASSEEDRWYEEFNELYIDEQFVNALNTADRVIYGKTGRYVTRASEVADSNGLIIPAHLSILETIGLITIDHEKRRIQFTPKGLYFVKSLRHQVK
jgi:ribosomal protein S19E (S16A)